MAGAVVRVLAEQAMQRLEALEQRGGNLTGLFRSFGEHMKESIEKNFDAEGRPTRWAPLSPATLVGWVGGYKKGGSYRTKGGRLTAKGAAAVSGRKILTQSGILRRSVYYVAQGMGIEVIAGGAGLPYAAIHQFGGQAGRGHKVSLPARPYLLFQDEDIDWLERGIVMFLVEGKTP